MNPEACLQGIMKLAKAFFAVVYLAASRVNTNEQSFLCQKKCKFKSPMLWHYPAMSLQGT